MWDWRNAPHMPIMILLPAKCNPVLSRVILLRIPTGKEVCKSRLHGEKKDVLTAPKLITKGD